MNQALLSRCQRRKASLLRLGHATAVALFLAASFMGSGCAYEDRYTYDRIRAEREASYGSFPGDAARSADPLVCPDPSEPLSLDQAVRIAVVNNPDMDAALSRIRQSDAMIDQARALFWPTLSVYAEHMRGEAPSAYLFKTIDQRALPARVDFNDPGSFRSNEMGVDSRLNLFRGGRDYLRMRLAETGLGIHELDRMTVQNGLVTSVIHAFFDTLAARDYIRIARESVDTVEAQLRIVKVRYRAGGALKSDVLSLEVRLAQSREELIRAENSHSLALASLCNLMGLDPDEDLQTTESGDLALEVPSSYEAGLPLALARRPELEKARLAVIRSRMGVDMARGEYLPTLDARARTYAADRGLDFDGDRMNWTAGIIMNWDLFTGRSTDASIRKASGVLDEMLAADRKVTLSVKLELRASYLRLSESCARLDVARASVAAAEESLRLVKTQYEGGSASVTRYLDAELDRNRTEIRSTAAFYDREKARADVSRAIGHWADYGDDRIRDSAGPEGPS